MSIFRIDPKTGTFVLSHPVFGILFTQKQRVYNFWTVNQRERSGNIKAEWLSDRALHLALTALMPSNRLVLELCICTGLRVGDAVNLTVKQIRNGRPVVTEAKTGKKRRIYIPEFLQHKILAYQKAVFPAAKYVFPHRLRPKTDHKTRQSVYKDCRRAADALRLDANFTPHTTRKVYAVRDYAATGDLTRVQRDLNHSDPSVTLIYAMADKIRGTSYKTRQRRRRRRD